jgi:septal ring factor EnvC (AmiA/AmiB activator)
MNQKLEDLKLLLKNDKRILAGAAFLVVVLLFLLFSSDQRAPRPNRPNKGATGAASKQGMSAEDQFTDLIIAFKNDIESGKKQSAEMSAQLNRTEKDAQNFRQQTAGIFETITDKVEQVQRDLDKMADALNRGNSDVGITPPQPVSRAG